MKRLIICCDGTWNHLEMKQPTNVVAVAQNLKLKDESDPDNPILQLSYYDEGVGTTSGNFLTEFAEKYIGGGLGFGLDHNVRQAYRFLANNYEDGDEIYCFGFSRGAYTIRSLAGLLNFAGLLSRQQLVHIFEAYELYREEKRANSAAAEAFRATHGSVPPAIKFMGCWDTVGALGLPNKIPGVNIDDKFNERFRFIDNHISPYVMNARHAVAIDEERKEFDVTLMAAPANPRALQELWFAGDHGCAGGGTVNKVPLSNIALEWLCKEAESIGLAFHDNFFTQIKHKQNPFAYYEYSRSAIYSYHRRTIPSDAQFHESALNRVVNVTPYAAGLPNALKNQMLGKAQQANIQRKTADPAHPVTLNVGDRVQTIVQARVLPDALGVLLRSGERYQVSVEPHLYWQDESIMCTANGWHVEDPLVEEQLSGMLSQLKKTVIRAGRSGRVIPNLDWFTLVLCFDEEPDEEKLHYQVTTHSPTEFVAESDGKLYAFANDYKSFFVDQYSNNRGWLPITIKRLPNN